MQEIRTLLNNKIALIIIILAIISIPLRTLYIISSTPEGLEFAFSRDELTAIAVGNSYLWDYKSPYGILNLSAFAQPLTTGSNYLNIFISLLIQTFPVDEYLITFAITLISSIVLFIILYSIISFYFKSQMQRVTSLLFFLVISGGLGGIVYIFLTITGILPSDQLIHFISRGGLAGVFFQYRTVSLMFGYFALYMILKNKLRYTYITLGLSIIIYPIYGVPFALVILVYSMVSRQWKQTGGILLTTIVFLIPWVLFLLDPVFTSHSFFKDYVTKGDFVNIFVFITWGIILLPLAGYFSYIYLRKHQRSNSIDFLIIWATIITVLTIFPPGTPLQSGRLLAIVWFPLALIAAHGFFTLFRNHSENKKIFYVVMMILLTIPTISIAFYNIPDPYTSTNYMKSSHVRALRYLRQEPEGLLLTEPSIGLRAPYYARKRSLVTSSPSLNVGVGDVYGYIIENTTADRLAILNRYNVSYVMLVYDISFSLPGFEIIYTKDDVTILKRVE